MLGTGQHAPPCPASQQGLIVPLQPVVATIDLGTGGGLVVDVTARVNGLAKGQRAGLAIWSGEACGGIGREGGERLHLPHVAGSQLNCRPSISAAASLNLKANHNCTWPATTDHWGRWPAGCTLSCCRGHCRDKDDQLLTLTHRLTAFAAGPGAPHALPHLSAVDPLAADAQLHAGDVDLQGGREGGWGGWGGAEGAEGGRGAGQGNAGREEGRGSDGVAAAGSWPA